MKEAVPLQIAFDQFCREQKIGYAVLLLSDQDGDLNLISGVGTGNLADKDNAMMAQAFFSDKITELMNEEPIFQLSEPN